MDDLWTVANYLRGLIEPFEISDDSLRSVLLRVGVGMEDNVSALCERDLDLSEGYLLLWCSQLPVTRNNTRDADGGWEHTTGGYTLSAGQRTMWLRRAVWLLGKWGVDTSGFDGRTVIKNL